MLDFRKARIAEMLIKSFSYFGFLYLETFEFPSANRSMVKHHTDTTKDDSVNMRLS